MSLFAVKGYIILLSEEEQKTLLGVYSESNSDKYIGDKPSALPQTAR